MTTLPVDSEVRKGIPLLHGCFRYFAAALAGVARWSKIGNDKHNPGEPLHHSRGKSSDHGDCVLRHLMDIQDYLAAIERSFHSVTPEEVRRLLDEADALSWRSLALSQDLHERFGGAPLAPGAKLPVAADRIIDVSPVDSTRKFVPAEAGPAFTILPDDPPGLEWTHDDSCLCLACTYTRGAAKQDAARVANYDTEGSRNG